MYRAFFSLARLISLAGLPPFFKDFRCFKQVMVHLQIELFLNHLKKVKGNNP